MIEDHQLPGSGPYVTIYFARDEVWSYRWWNSGDAFVIGEAPSRTKSFVRLEGVLAALLADRARTGHYDPPLPF